MKKNLLFILVLFLLLPQSTFGSYYTNLQNQGTPVATYFLGDKLQFIFYFDINTNTFGWPNPQYGIGKSNDGTGWTWNNATYSSNNGTNWTWKSNTNEAQFTSIGNWYYSGKYTDGSSYTEYACKSWASAVTSLTGNVSSYFTVNTLENPTATTPFTVTISTVALAWSKDAQSHNVMIIRKKSTDSWTEPTQGTAYTVGTILGSGVVVYNSNGTSFNDTGLTSSTAYDYKYYSENNSFYSAGATASATTTSAAADNFRSKVTGKWSTASNWESSPDNTNWITSTLVPEATATSITISNGTNITLDQDATIPNLTINSGGAFIASDGTARSLTISSGGTLANTGTFTPATSTVTFAGTGAVTGTVGFNNVTLAGGVDFGSGSTINGTLQLNAGGYVNSNAPTYASSSTLKYNSGTTFGRGIEWNSPSNVQISNNTTLNYPNGNNSFSSSITGNLSVDAGSALYMDYGDGSQAGSLTVGGAVTVNGNLSLGDGVGGDIYVGGNWTTGSGSNFNANSRAIFFNGTAEQTITNPCAAIFPYMIIQPGAKVTLAEGNSLSVTNFTINSSSLNNTGTFVNKGTFTNTTATVNQTLGTDRNWYVSSPVSADPIPTADLVNYYDETVVSSNLADSWKTPTTGTTLAVGKGYVVNPTSSAYDKITFTGGTLNNGDQPALTLTRTTAKTSYVGFNLVGNPYPSYLNANALLNDASNSNVLKTIWYRTNDGTTWSFPTFNAEAGIGIPTNTLGLIPPMQAFWVRATADNVSFTFKDAMRTHNTTGSSIPFKAPDASAKILQQVLRLDVTNGTSTDEAVVYFNPNASNDFDAYDSPKMMNGSTSVLPDIYTSAGSEQLAINGMNTIPYNVEIPLYLAKNATSIGSFTISASEFSNFDQNTKVYLVDNLNNTQNDLTTASYSFDASTSTNARFSLIFKTTSGTSGVNTLSNNNTLIYRNSNNQISVHCTDPSNATVTVYNSLGQKLVERYLTGTTTVIDTSFHSGVYLVMVSNLVDKAIQKVILN